MKTIGGREVLGVLLIVCGTQCSVAANTVAKLLAGVPLLQLMQARFFLQWMCSMGTCMTLKLRGGDFIVMGPPGCKPFLLAHAAFVIGALMSIWNALRHLPVGEVTSCVYLHPVVCGLLARGLLKEPLGKVFWAQAAVSCIGVTLVANAASGVGAAGTSSDQFIGHAFALSACFSFAAANCTVRSMPPCRPLEIQVFTDSLVALIAMPILLLFLSTDDVDWHQCTGERASLLVAFTAFGLGTSVLAISGFRMAPATIAALFMYLEVPGSFAVQVFIFDQVPNMLSVIGAALITGAALARLALEAQRQRQLQNEDGLADTFISPGGSDLDDLDDYDMGQFSRRGTLESCMGPCILAQKTAPLWGSEMPYKRSVTEEPQKPTKRKLDSYRQATY
jgi:drug/metabolite transporter (DMT)-like permease